MTKRAVATFNVGSSSLKFSLYALEGSGALGDCLLRGALRDIYGARKVDLTLGGDGDALHDAVSSAADPISLIQSTAHWLNDQAGGAALAGVGHRIVHGGTYFDCPAIAKESTLDLLETLSVFAPSHQPFNLAGVRALTDAMRGTVQTLSFDTAFHRTMPPVAERYALPRALSEDGIRRFGFHGLSYTHIAETLPIYLGKWPSRVVCLHLGSGASACAMLNGKSIATSMGLTALDGLPMATRCGDLDPGVVLHLIQDRGMDPDEVADLLYKHSGLLGMSGLSSDTRTLLESDSPEAEDAIALYCYRVAREAGSLATALGGLDAVVFSGGVGENAPEIRRRIIDHLAWLGPTLDPNANAANADVISTQNALVPIVRLVADEEHVIARDCADLLIASR